MVNGAFMVLKGHRSIVNQVRFNPHTYMICSSGVEKVIKVWSPYQQPDSLGDLEGRVEDKSRSLYTHEEYISLVLNSGSGLSHDYVSQSIQEDPRMMAFFDSLVRREIEGWSSDSDSDLSEEAIMQLHARGRRTTRPRRRLLSSCRQPVTTATPTTHPPPLWPDPMPQEGKSKPERRWRDGRGDGAGISSISPASSSTRTRTRVSFGSTPCPDLAPRAPGTTPRCPAPPLPLRFLLEPPAPPHPPPAPAATTRSGVAR